MSGTDRTVLVGRAPPRISTVVASVPATVRVTWADGERKGRTEAVDLGPMLYTRKLYRPLRDDPDLFKTAHAAAFGSAIAWGEDEAIDMSAAAIEELAGQAMSTLDFKEFLERNRLTFDAAAAQLGLGRRVIAYYAGGRSVPRTVALACAHLDRMLSMKAQSASDTAGHASRAGALSTPPHLEEMSAHLEKHLPPLSGGSGEGDAPAINPEASRPATKSLRRVNMGRARKKVST